MDTDETIPQKIKRFAADLIASILVALVPAVIAGTIVCFIIEAQTGRIWEGVWPPLSWGAAIIGFTMSFVFCLETPFGCAMCTRIVWRNKLMNALFPKSPPS